MPSHQTTPTDPTQPISPGNVGTHAEATEPAKPEQIAEPPYPPQAELDVPPEFFDPAAALAEAEMRLAEAEMRIAEQHDAWLRAKAETENLRRRAQEEVAKATKFAAEKFAAAMLPVKDSLEAALATEGQTLEKLREGVELTLKQTIAAFESVNLAEENPLGQKFDPNKHQAIGAVESDAEPNTVIYVLQKGYLLHERVIRPAMVSVARAKA